MVSKSRRLHTIGVVVLLLASAGIVGQAQIQTPKAELPLLIASCGQSPGADMIKVILNRLKLESGSYTVEMLATADHLKDGARNGNPYKTLMIVMGASLKGMGAAGISMDDELDRIAALISAANAQGIKIIGTHIEGLKRRAQGAAVGDNTDELSIDAVAPNSDLLLINKEGDSDGRFSRIAGEKEIPMVVVEKNLELLEKLGEMFKSP